MPFPLIPVSRSPPQMHLRGRTIKQCLFLIMAPHRGPINTSRWLQSRQHPILTDRSSSEVPQAMPFLWLPSISSIQSLPKHPILTEVPSDLCDHNGPTLEPNKYKSTRTISSTSFRNLSKQCLSLWLPSFPKHRNWQKLLLILATIMVPHRSPTTGRSCF